MDKQYESIPTAGILAKDTSLDILHYPPASPLDQFLDHGPFEEVHDDDR